MQLKRECKTLSVAIWSLSHRLLNDIVQAIKIVAYVAHLKKHSLQSVQCIQSQTVIHQSDIYGMRSRIIVVIMSISISDILIKLYPLLFGRVWTCMILINICVSVFVPTFSAQSAGFSLLIGAVCCFFLFALLAANIYLWAIFQLNVIRERRTLSEWRIERERCLHLQLCHRIYFILNTHTHTV